MADSYEELTAPMNIIRLGTGILGIALVGCATSSLPLGARLVGGGLLVDYTAPGDGTVILIERTSGRTVATKSVSEGDDFTFRPHYEGCDDVLVRMFGSTNAMETGDVRIPANTFFELYFVPTKAKEK